MALANLIFIDTNIWLDFYRAKNESGLQLLKRTEGIAGRIIVSFQLESEFKKNRQAAILDGLSALKEPSQLSRPGIFSDAKATRVIARNIEEAEKRVKKLRTRLIRALENPAQNDPVYQICQRIFQKPDELTLTRENPIRRSIRRSAMRRFLHGCPPRKASDTSYGDGFNWEWMIRCAEKKKAGLVIVSRDSDYGVTVDKKSYINDELRHEFSDRVSQTRKLVLHSRLSDALKLFDVPVSKKEEEAEKDLMSVPHLNNLGTLADLNDPNYVNYLAAIARNYNFPTKLAAFANWGQNYEAVDAYIRNTGLDKIHNLEDLNRLADLAPKAETEKNQNK